MNDDERSLRVAMVEISPWLLVDLLRRGKTMTFEITENGLPEDAKLVGCRYDAIRQVLELGIMSAEYERLVEGCDAPLLPPPSSRLVSA